MLISAHQLSKTFGAKPLFQEITFGIENGDRIGLIGPNGAGKSTLLRILTQQLEADQGTLSFEPGLRIGYVAQTPTFKDQATIYSSLLEKTIDPDDWQTQSYARQCMSQIGLNRFEEDTLVQTLSGGWKKRVAIARELVAKPDVLFLDEPTNHMDVLGITWLENFLVQTSMAIMSITHDRLFLQRVSNRIIEINPRVEGGMLSIKGDYTQFLDHRDHVIQSQEKREIVLKNTLRRETQWLKAGVKARTTKQQARIKSTHALQKDVDQLEKRNIDQKVRLAFVGAEKLPKKLIEAKHVSQQLGDTLLFQDVSLTIGPGTRMGLLGQNGSGKTTLIKTLLGNIQPTQGSIEKSDELKVAYFDQHRADLDPSMTVMQALSPHGDHVEYNGQMVHIRGYLDRFLFATSQHTMKISQLSGGEQSRLMVARLMLEPANLLVLDEPTNDLDMATLNVLESCLQEFPGAIILVSHDRYFLDQTCDQLLAFPPTDSKQRKLITFADFYQWEQWQQEQSTSASKNSDTKSSVKAPAKLKLSYKEQYELDHMDETIEALETQMTELEAKSQEPDTLQDVARLTALSSEMAALKTKLDNTYQRWQDLEAKENAVKQQ